MSTRAVPALRSARFRILGPAFARALDRAFAGESRATIARRLHISLPTLRKLLRGDGTVNTATVERLEAALRVERASFALVDVDPARDVVPTMTALPAAHLQATLHALAANPVVASLLAQIGRHVHWRNHVADPARPFRQSVTVPATWPATGAYARLAIDAGDAPLELVLAFPLRALHELDLVIDFGLVRLDATTARTWELIGRRGVSQARRPGPVTVLAWIPGHDRELVLRSDHPCRVRHVATLALTDGDTALDPPDPELGFRAMGYFHVPPAPWGR